MKKIIVVSVSIIMFLGILGGSLAASPDWTVVAPGEDIQTAINNISGSGTVYLEAGTHNVSATIQLRSYVTLVGAGRIATVINYTGSAAAFESTDVHNLSIKDLKISCGGNGTYGLLLNHTTESIIENVKISNFSNTGICFNSNSWSNRLINCMITGNNDGIFLGSQSNAIMISGCIINGNTENGILISYANGCQIMTNQIEGNGIGIHIAACGGVSSAKGLKINNNYFEEPNALYIDEGYGYAQSVENLTFSDNYIWSLGEDYAVVADNPNGNAYGVLSGNHFWGVAIAGVLTKNSNDRLLVIGVRAFGPGWSTGTSKALLDNNNGTSGSSSITADYKKITVKDVVKLQPRTAAPSSPSQGCIYFDSTSAKLMVYDGTTWRMVKFQ